MNEAVLRDACPSDLDALVGIENAAFQTDRLSRRSLRRMIEADTAAVIVAELGGKIAGYAAVLFRASSRSGRLYSIAVAEGFTGRRVGARLLAAAEAEALRRGCKSLRLEVRVDNALAAALYRMAGYAPSGERAAYYEDGATALRFEKPLSMPGPGFEPGAP